MSNLAGIGAAAARESQVQAEFIRLEKEVIRLEDVAQMLEQRLSNVTVPQDNQTKPEGPKPPSALVPMGTRILQIREKITAIVESLNSLLQRIEL